MDHLILSANLASTFTCLVGLVAFIQSPKSRLNQLFICYSWSIALWSFGFSRMHTIPTAWAVWWGRLLHLGCTFIPVFFFHVCVKLSGTEERDRSKLITAYLIALTYNLLNLQPGIFTAEIVYRAGYAYPRPIGFLYLSYFLIFWGLVTLGLLRLWQFSQQLKGKQALSFRLFTASSVLGYLGGLNNFLIMIDVTFFPIFPYGLYLVVLYVLVTWYLISKCSLLRLRSELQPALASARS